MAEATSPHGQLPLSHWCWWRVWVQQVGCETSVTGCWGGDWLQLQLLGRFDLFCFVCVLFVELLLRLQGERVN